MSEDNWQKPGKYASVQIWWLVGTVLPARATVYHLVERPNSAAGMPVYPERTLSSSAGKSASSRVEQAGCPPGEQVEGAIAGL